MDIKNFLHQKKENKKKQIMIISIISLGFVLLITLGVFIRKNQIKPIYSVWDGVVISWKIHYDNNFPINTHKISNKEQSFWLKSSAINLNNLVNKNILLNWKISEMSLKHPILQIENIKIPDSKVIINENKYFFTNELISFDFSKDIDLKAERTWRSIIIYYQNEPILSVETFVCSKITPTQNCEDMMMNYTKNLNEMFTTYLWYVFYKNKENSRVTFNEDTIGYIFRTTDNNFLLNMSHLINIVNSKFIVENKKDLILNNCTDDKWNQLNTINKLSKEIVDENLVKIDVEGLNSNKELMKCKLTINIWDNRKIETVNISN